MTGDLFDPEEFTRLSDVAKHATIRKVSSSALGNLLDDVVSITMTEYWTVVQNGTQINDPEAMVATIGRRRAIDHARAWNLRRNRRIGFDRDDEFDLGIDEDLLPEVEAPLPSTLEIVNLIERAGAGSITATQRPFTGGIVDQRRCAASWVVHPSNSGTSRNVERSV